MTFEPRERLIFETLRELRNFELVLIGGLALNAYVLPRFSIDCDLVMRRRGVAARIERVLEGRGFEKVSEGKTMPPGGEFVVYTRRVDGLKANFDLLVRAVTDRWSGAIFEAKWFLARSRVRRVWARSVPIWVEIRTADPEILLIMKLIIARKQDIRDTFMLAGLDLDWEYIKKWVKKVPRRIIAGGVKKCRTLVESADFKDGLHGVFGKVERGAFEWCRRRLVDFLEELGF
jgi:hypothetical protein